MSIDQAASKHRTMSVSTIRSGTVIDHIPPGQAMQIVRLLNLDNTQEQILIAMRLRSVSMGRKDLIKIENRELSSDDMSVIAVFAPTASVSIIRNFCVEEKYSVDMPEALKGYLSCPNKTCITHSEKNRTLFHISYTKKAAYLTCHYCEETFTNNNFSTGCSL